MEKVQNVVRNYKDTVFRMLFSDKKRLLELYNALNDTGYDNPNELKITTFDNAGYNGELMDTCRTLDEYCQYVERVRKHIAVMPIEEAVECAVKECIKEDILADFLKRQRAEVVAMSIFEYDEETELKKLRASERKFAEERTIVVQVCKKLKKNYTIPQIADALEETEEQIEKIYRVAEKYAPEYDIKAICWEIFRCDIDDEY